MLQLYNEKTNYDYKRNLGACFQKKNLNLSLNLKNAFDSIFFKREKETKKTPWTIMQSRMTEILRALARNILSF